MQECSRDRLHDLVRQANGMLSTTVYDAIFDVAAKAPGPTFVEVGTGHGAATIALGLGATRAIDNVFVHTIDRLGGPFSSRSRYGSVNGNRDIILQNCLRAGLAERVSLFVGTSDEFINTGRCPGRIDLLMLDADGRIDRDLLHFYDALAPDAIVIIDDVDDHAYLKKMDDGTPYVDLKHRITSMLLEMLVGEEYLCFERKVQNTAFCRRVPRKLDREKFIRAALDIYRELVFTTVTEPGGADRDTGGRRGYRSLIQRYTPSIVLDSVRSARRYWQARVSGR